MKHVSSPTEADALLDLSKPSLGALSFLLRHREMWPKGFVWDYTRCENCAMGLAWRLWNEVYIPDEYVISELFSIPYKVSEQIFCDAEEGRDVFFEDITPEHIASDIGAYLARSSSFGQV